MSLRYVLYGISDSGVRVGRVVNPSAHPREIWRRGFLTRNVKKNSLIGKEKKKRRKRNRTRKKGGKRRGWNFTHIFVLI